MGTARPLMDAASVELLGVRVDLTSYADASAQIIRWARQGASHYVCCANVHMIMEAVDSPAFAEVVNGASLVTPDGMPLVWFARGVKDSQARVYGPDLMLDVCRAAAAAKLPIGLLGATETTLATLRRTLEARFPELSIVYSHAPPFGSAGAGEDARVVEECTRSGARIMFVGLGCPKQERWMADHRGRIPMVMVGVGAAFDFHAGKVAQAPSWMQQRGLEWLFRLLREPRRLARRYVKHNPRFVVRALPAYWRLRQDVHARRRELPR